MSASVSEVTQLLRAWSAGNHTAGQRLFPLIYYELRSIARRCVRREQPDRTLDTTALLHEAYLRLAAAGQIRWEDRVHFFASAAQIMRRILVDAARRRSCIKRGEAVRRASLEEENICLPAPEADVVALDEALQTLARFDSRKARVVELRFFGGLTVEETAAALNVSPQTVLRDWKLARAWLSRELNRSAADGT